MEFIDEELDGAKTNHILLEGYICKKPVYRKTPLGRRLEICFWLLIVLMGNPIIFRVSAGEEMRGMRQDSRWVNMCRFWEESKAGLCEENFRDGNTDKNRLRSVSKQTGVYGIRCFSAS